MWNSIVIYIKDFYNLLYPSICCACGNHLYDGEDCICIACRMSLPYSNDEHDKWNNTYKVFEGRARISAASSLFYFKKKSKTQNLLHYLKYKNHDELGIVLGRMHALQLANSALFSEIDYVVPVPLHPNKFKLRGYNQATLIAKGYAEGLSIECREDLLVRISETSTQTRKNRFERYENMSNVFQCMNIEDIIDKNILLVDDVITTGSTLESCANELSKHGCKNIYIVSIAIA